MPAALDVDWVAIRTLSESGAASFSELAKRFNVSVDAIKKRAQRQGWATQPRLASKLAELKAKQSKPILSPVSLGTVIAPENPALAYQLDTLQAIREGHPLRLARYLDEKVSRALAGDMLPDVTSYDRLQTADTLLRRAVGLDKPGQVNVNVGVFANEDMWAGIQVDDRSNDPKTIDVTEVPSGDIEQT